MRPLFFWKIGRNLFWLSGFKSSIYVHFIIIKAFKKVRKIAVRSLKLFTIFTTGALCYGLMEIINRGFTHITMGVLGGFSFLVIHTLNEERRTGRMKTLPILIISAFFITSIEFLSGEILNRLLGMNIWSYRDMPFNIDEQICLPFSLIWFGLSFFGVFADDFIRHNIFLENKNYRYFKQNVPQKIAV